MRTIHIPIFVAHMGCPHQCVFCNQKAITHTGGGVDEKAAQSQIERAIATLPREGCKVEIAYFGGSFTGIEPQRQEELLALAQSYVEQGLVQGIRLSTRPDMMGPEVMERLCRYGVTAVELGAQSMDDQVLTLSRRGHTARQVEEAARKIKTADMELGLQMMVGLPGDSKEAALSTAQRIVELGADTTRIYPALVLRHTPMEGMYESGTFRPLTVEEGVEWCAPLVELFEEKGVTILRLGLMAEENLSPEKDLVAGPYHPAFGELVRSRIWRRRVEEALGHQQGAEVLWVNPRQLSQAKGNGKCNERYWQTQYGRPLAVKADASVPLGQFRLE